MQDIISFLSLLIGIFCTLEASDSFRRWEDLRFVRFWIFAILSAIAFNMYKHF